MTADRRLTMGHSEYDPAYAERRPWNAGRKLGTKRALKPQQVWAIRFWLDREHRLRDRALFDLAIDSKLRGCDLVKIRVGDLISGGRVRSRAIVIQQKTGRPVQFELLESARILATRLPTIAATSDAEVTMPFPTAQATSSVNVPACAAVLAASGARNSSMMASPTST
jgi:hypothetical protein